MGRVCGCFLGGLLGEKPGLAKVFGSVRLVLDFQHRVQTSVCVFESAKHAPHSALPSPVSHRRGACTSLNSTVVGLPFSGWLTVYPSTQPGMARRCKRTASTAEARLNRGSCLQNRFGCVLK